MIRTKFWLSILAISVVLIAGSLAVSPIAVAGGDDEIVITGTTGTDLIIINEDPSPVFGAISCKPLMAGSCTVTGPVTQLSGSAIIWTYNSGAGNGFDDEYKIIGNGGSDIIRITDGTSSDDDEFEVENADSVEYTDGPGDDKLEFEG